MRHSLLLALGALLCMRLASGAPIPLPWNDLGPRITDRKVALVLPSGVHIEGKVKEVTADGLRLRVTKTSDRKQQPKGEHLIPRQSVSVLRVTEYRKLGRVIATTGALAVTGGILAATYEGLYEGPLVVAVPAGIAAGMTGVAIGGYYTGKRIDRRIVEIAVIPEAKGQ